MTPSTGKTIWHIIHFSKDMATSDHPTFLDETNSFHCNRRAGWLELHASLIISNTSKEFDSTMTLSKILLFFIIRRPWRIAISSTRNIEQLPNLHKMAPIKALKWLWITPSQEASPRSALCHHNLELEIIPGEGSIE